MNIVGINAPTNETEEQDKTDFYIDLQDVMEKLPVRDINIVIGDANAKVLVYNAAQPDYEDVMGRYAEGTMDDNREMFASMCSLTV